MRQRRAAGRLAGMVAVVSAIGLAGCAGGSAVQAADPVARGSATGSSARQTPDQEARTLASLTRVDEHPLYTMTFSGDYDPLPPVGAGPQPQAAAAFGCSLFVAFADPANPLFGRNFDWDHNPALLLFTDPPDGYASVSVVDIHYLGVDRPADLETEDGRRALLDAPLLPFDGMNEHGLAVGLAALDGSQPPSRPDRPTVGGVRILRLVLDRAKSVDEAIAIFDAYNLDFSGGPGLHYLLADATGDAAVVEFLGGRMRVVHGAPPWQALTNFQLTGSTADQRAGDWRYRTAEDQLDRFGTAPDWRTAMGILAAVAQPHTQWSVTYGLKSGEVHLATDRDFTTVHTFRLRR